MSFWENRTVLVTGGAGFIGSHLVGELVRRGARVRALDDFSTGKRKNLQIANCKSQISYLEVIEGDVRDPEAVRRATNGADYVLHQAALASVPQSIADPQTTHAVNVTGTLNVLMAAREAGVRRVVFASSAAVYGDNDELPLKETAAPKPLSPYAASKLAGEAYCQTFSIAYGLPAVALRYFNVFGPRQDPTSQYSAVIPKFITSLLRGEPPTIYGDGTQSRDFTYVANVVKANLLACEKEEAIGQVMNVACGERYTLLDLCRELAELTGKTLQPTFAPPRAGDVKHSMAAIDRARQWLGYAPEVGWREGLWRTVEWYVGQAQVEG
jgi:nucleoside-diphosphate-sugar epimerase